MTKSGFAAVLVAAASLVGARAAYAQEDAYEEAYDQSQAPPNTPVPPYVEGAPAAAAGGSGFCYGGPHPVDTRVVNGAAWDGTHVAHLHEYPPFDLRLFVLRDGCYHFVGDPTDFGYRGTSYRYYGAHPVLDVYGGGWCFMIAGHAHWWRPWSPYFTMAGPWYYWYGAYDPFFWSYWPYYAFYYRAYYPHYYGGGRFHRGGWRRDRAVAPPVGRMAGGPARAMPANGMGMSTGAPMGGGPAPTPARGSWNRTPGWPAQSNGWSQPNPSVQSNGQVGGDIPSVGWSTHPGRARSTPVPGTGSSGNRGGFNAAPERSYVPARPSFQGDASGWTGSFRAPAQQAPTFRSTPVAPSRGFSPSPGFRSSPAPAAPARGFSPSPSSGFRGGSSGGGWGSGGGRRR